MTVYYLSPEKLDYLPGKAVDPAATLSPAAREAQAGPGDLEWTEAVRRLFLSALGGPLACHIMGELVDGGLSPSAESRKTGRHKGTESRRIDRMKAEVQEIRSVTEDYLKRVAEPWGRLRKELVCLQTAPTVRG
jgi:hypothetical protein